MIYVGPGHQIAKVYYYCFVGTGSFLLLLFLCRFWVLRRFGVLAFWRTLRNYRFMAPEL
jgi:hypothetical protein